MPIKDVKFLLPKSLIEIQKEQEAKEKEEAMLKEMDERQRKKWEREQRKK